jgi:hypothetical protein
LVSTPWERRGNRASIGKNRTAAINTPGSRLRLLTMEVLGRYWRTRPGTRGHVFPANRVKGDVKNASRGVARVVSDVSVLCPRAVVGFDNYPSLPMDMGVRRWALTSDSTLRFRERAEVETSLVQHGQEVHDVRAR